jgi:spore coat protein U-like protein
MTRRLALLCCFALAALGASTHASAAENCSVATTDIAFGTYNPVSVTPLPGAGQVTVDCQGNAHVVIIALGTGGASTFAGRRMILGTDAMSYNLYTDAARTVVWGDGNSGTSTVTCTTGTDSNGCIGTNPTGGDRRATRAIYGRVPALQNLGAGTYTDTMQVTVTF